MIMYAAPAWWVFLSVAQKDCIESVVKKAYRYGYLPSDFEHVHTLMEYMESKLFNSVLSNSHHVLYHLLPPVRDIGYNLRQRFQSLTLCSEGSNFIRKNFLHIMLFTDIYQAFICVIVFSSSFYCICCQFLSHILLYACCYDLRLSNLIKETTYLLNYNNSKY